MSDPNEKRPRSFQCRDGIWESLEQMAGDLECSVDYLINEALKQYLRQRGTRTNAGARNRDDGLSATPNPVAAAAPPPMATPAPPRINTPTPFAAPVSRGPSAQPPLGPPSGQFGAPLSGGPRSPSVPFFREGGGQGNPSGPPPPLPPSYGPPQQQSPAQGPPWSGRPVPPPERSAPGAPPPYGPPPLRAPVQQGGFGGQSPPYPSSTSTPPPVSAQPPVAPPPLPSPLSAAPPPASDPANLAVFYSGQRHPVNKDRFIIGRGQKVADLTIKDPNISRQHAMVELVGGQYFIVDMGSTNGIEHNGQRISRKPIVEGDVVRICEHEVRFTYR